MVLDKAKLALLVMAGILVLELVGAFTIIGISVYKYGESRVPAEIWTAITTTLALFSGVSGSMFLNGRVKKSETQKKEIADDPKTPGSDSDRIRL